MQQKLLKRLMFTALMSPVLMAYADDIPLFTPAKLSPEQMEVRSKSDDPKINPKERFKVSFESSGPISIEFNTNDVAKTHNIFASDAVNQLGIVTPGSFKGHNKTKNVFAVISVIGGHYQKGMFDDDTKDFQRGDRLTEVIDRTKLENPLLNEIPALVDKAVIEIAKTHPELSDYEDISVYPSKGWNLVYDDENKPDAQALYSLQMGAVISKEQENAKGGFFKVKPRNEIMCIYASDPKQLSEWEKNDYELVAIERAKAVNNCNQTIKTSIQSFLQLDK